MLSLSFVNRLISNSNMEKFCFYIFTIVLMFEACNAEELDKQLYIGDSIIKVDNPFTIRCNLTAFEAVKWQKDGINIVPSEANNFTLTQREIAPGAVEAVLSVSHAHVKHTGRYRCSSFHPVSHLIFVISGNEIITNADFGQFKILYTNAKLVLECNVSQNAEGKLVWRKEGTVLSDNERITISPFSLTINKALASDVGNYSCSMDLMVSGVPTPIHEEFFVIVRPSLWLPKTVNIVEGEKLLLNCSVSGYPIPSVTWEIGNLTLDKSTDRIILQEDRGVPNAILLINEVTLEDRDYYRCIANNLANTTDTKIYVRVKDKLAALWPFLGICAEVVVLCTIILIYEKRRNKAELEESDTDQSPEQKNAGDMGKDSDVRHRK